MKLGALSLHLSLMKHEVEKKQIARDSDKIQAQSNVFINYNAKQSALTSENWVRAWARTWAVIGSSVI